jgi:CO/xanthine dehydrogenase Mo-binding subunit
VGTPSWNPETDDAAPVSLRKAIEIARTNLKRLIPESTEKWDVEKVTLHQMGQDKWLYEVAFYCFLARCGLGANDGFTLYVKMDGSIVEPEKAVAKK